MSLSTFVSVGDRRLRINDEMVKCLEIEKVFVLSRSKIVAVDLKELSSMLVSIVLKDESPDNIYIQV